MTFHYQSGEEIQKGDRVTMHEQAARIELVAEAPGDSETQWYVEEFGGGVVVLELEPKVFGRIFLSEPQDAEDLVFVSRGSLAG